MAWLINLVAQLSDPVILATGAVSTAALAYVIAVVARRYWFEPRGAELEPQTTSLPSLVPLPQAAVALVRLLPLVLPEPQEPLV